MVDEVVCAKLIDDAEVPLVLRLVDEPAHQYLVVLQFHGLSLRPIYGRPRPADAPAE